MNPVDMNFSGGITAVLGPNGCGKTNIVDAIRWVLGEQKTRMLRNTKMENVIFNGTKLRKPIGMAEVHMTLSNEDRTLQVDYDEVTIARKLFRSGLSEYYVNGEAARLKDIRGLLIDSGLGSHTYSIIEREMVDSVISDKDQDKRFLLEEAAGVIRYRVHREEALRKIKHTETDLTRLADILAELDKELRSLRYQMGKARRYARLKDQVDGMESASIKRSLFDLLNKSDEIKQEKAHHEGITLIDENEITLREDRLQESRIAGAEFERKLQDLHEERYKISQALQQREEKIAILTERINTNKNRIEEDEGEIQRSIVKISKLAEDMVLYRNAIAKKEEEFGGCKLELSDKESELSEVTRVFEGIKNQLRDKKQLALNLVREKERERGLREHLQNRLDELDAKKREAANESQQLRGDEEKLNQSYSEASRTAAARREEVERLTRSLDEMSSRSEGVLEHLARCDDEYSKANIELHRCQEKKEYLERIRSEHSRGGEFLSGDDRVKGILADHVKVDRAYRKCFEACLSPILNGLMTASKDEALGCLESIQEAGAGRVQLLYPNGTGAARPQVSGTHVLGSALEFIEGDNEVMEYLTPHLGDVLVTRDVEGAIAVLREVPRARVATMDGVFFDGSGRILVSGAEDIDMTLLEFDTKLNELTTSISDLAKRSDELTERKERLSGEKAELSETVVSFRAGLRSAAVASERSANEQRECEVALARVREKLSALETTVAEADVACTEIRQKLEEQEPVENNKDDVEMTDEELTRLEHRAVDLEREKQSIGEAAGLIRLDIATVSGEIATSKEKLNNLEMIDTELKELIRSREEDAVRCREEIVVAEKDITESRTEIGGHHRRVEFVETEIESTKTAYDDIKQTCAGLEGELKELKTKRDEKKENLQRCELALATTDTKITGLLEKARENFNQDLAPYVTNRAMFDAAEWEQIKEEDLTTLRTKLEMFGPVNMLALEEFNEKKERYDFLVKQKADLDEAKEDLIQAIRRINREARKRLSETFEIVRANFKQTFLTLFDGGEADLLFVDSDDPLEAKIKIVASPKGKRLHDISSLSGGERALVALSLLFAIYLVKPSPFCVFDEVDAPLDDANIGRFVRMLNSFTDRTQFIVITHNKKTMEAADHLYGVTMQEAGVSRMVSVHIGDVDKFRDKPAPRRKTRSSANTTEEEEMPVQT
jgi:chromosome segregation protein